MDVFNPDIACQCSSPRSRLAATGRISLQGPLGGRAVRSSFRFQLNLTSLETTLTASMSTLCGQLPERL